jgi:hypothetical protein
MCPETPSAGHYFVTYFHDQINLHFEYFNCEKARGSFCNGSSVPASGIQIDRRPLPVGKELLRIAERLNATLTGLFCVNGTSWSWGDV